LCIFSRRNYVLKSFIWDGKSQTLLAVARKDGDEKRMVITTDMIADMAELVHKNKQSRWVRDDVEGW
jgi:hypothetical protein